MKNAVRVRPTREAEVARSAVTLGNAGVYMSVANGGTAVWIAIVPIRSAVTGTWPGCAGLAVMADSLVTRRTL